MQLIRPLFLTLLFLGYLTSGTAQDRFTGDRECGTEGKSEWLVKYQNGEIPRVAKSNDVLYVPTRIVILGRNDGTGYIDPVKLLNSFELLNEDYEDQNIQFYLDDIVYRNRTSYYEHSNSQTGAEMMIRYNEGGVINNYVVGDPAGNCGYYFPGSADAIALGKNCLGALDRTWSHEMGHLLSLPHTFYGWESVGEIDDIPEPAPATVRYRGEDVPVERVDGEGCEDAADGFCDTEPDYLMQRWRCESNQEYRDSLMDPDSVMFAVPARNIMSYALDNCIEGFSDEQQAAMLTNLTGRGLGNDSGADIEPAEGEDLTLVTPINNATLDFSDNTVLNWSPVAGADYYVVQLNRNSNNFNGEVTFSLFVTDTTLTLDDLDPDVRYFWRVRPVNRYRVDSDFGDQVWRFRNGSFPTATIDAALDAAITLAPNPVRGGQELFVGGRDLGISGQLRYELIDATGRVLQRRENVPVTSAGFTANLPTAGLAKGMYFLRIQLNEKLVTRRVVVY